MPPIYDFTQETFDHSLLKWVLKTLVQEWNSFESFDLSRNFGLNELEKKFTVNAENICDQPFKHGKLKTLLFDL